MMEVIGYGLEWAGIVYGVFNPHICTALINAYKEHRPNVDATSIEAGFYGWLGHCVLGWTEFNLRRLLGEISKDPHEINLGKEIIYERMIPCLDYLNKNEEMLIRYLNDLCQPNSR